MYIHISKKQINISLHINLNVLRKLMILCWATLIAVLGRIGQPCSQQLNWQILIYLLYNNICNDLLVGFKIKKTINVLLNPPWIALQHSRCVVLSRLWVSYAQATRDKIPIIRTTIMYMFICIKQKTISLISLYKKLSLGTSLPMYTSFGVYVPCTVYTIYVIV